jgi:hypothetical protein
MTSSVLRPIPIEEHPVGKKKYRIPTPSIADFHHLLSRCLMLRISGAIVYARTRVGKTCAIQFLESLLQEQMPSLPVLRMRCQHKRIPSETAFFSNLLTMARHKASSGRDPTKLRHRLTERLLEIADEAQGDRILVFLDEAQHLSATDFEWLRDAHDELDAAGVSPVIMFVGQPALRAKKSLFQRDGEEQIVARFMTEELPFHGVRNAADCATCLDGYDKQEYLDGSGWNHTRFFFPRAHLAGLRLAIEGSALWNAFDYAHKSAQLSGDLEIPMEYFTRAVHYVLLHHAAHDSTNFAFSKAIWDEAVEVSGYTRARQ